MEQDVLGFGLKSLSKMDKKIMFASEICRTIALQMKIKMHFLLKCCLPHCKGEREEEACRREGKKEKKTCRPTSLLSNQSLNPMVPMNKSRVLCVCTASKYKRGQTHMQ